MVAAEVTLGAHRYYYSEYRWLSGSKTLFSKDAQRAAVYEWNALGGQWEIGTPPPPTTNFGPTQRACSSAFGIPKLLEFNPAYCSYYFPPFLQPLGS
jgi:hypothetical protein